jgi:peptidoglycan/xylan/chitin deacetylase (PgdA/CDA1 family)
VQRRAFLRYFGVGGGIAVLSAGASGTAVGAVEYLDDNRSREDGAFGGVGTGQQRVIWSVPTREQVAALTFDDGPNPRYTERVLAVLAASGVKATFFMIGRLVQQNPDLVHAVLGAGHEVANHSWSHLSPALTGAETACAEIDRAADAIAALSGARPSWYRPPRGMITGVVLRHSFETGAGVAMWSVDRGDGADRDADSVRTHLVGALAPGAIINLHDGLGRSTWDTSTSAAHRLMARREAELLALPGVLEASLSAGYRFATISDLAAMQTSDATSRPPTA